MKARRKSRKTRHLVITPFIDIAFILVLFFIVDSSFELSPALDVSLPQSETALGSETFGLSVALLADGTVFVNGEESPLVSLSEAISAFDGNLPVELLADENARNGDVVKIFDELKKAGFSEVYLRTK